MAKSKEKMDASVQKKVKRNIGHFPDEPVHFTREFCRYSGNSRRAVNVVCNGCKFIQGNYLMEPVPEDDIIDFIRGEESNGRSNRETVHA